MLPWSPPGAGHCGHPGTCFSWTAHSIGHYDHLPRLDLWLCKCLLSLIPSYMLTVGKCFVSEIKVGNETAEHVNCHLVTLPIHWIGQSITL